MAYQKDAAIRYKKNADYFGEKALVDDLVFAITPDPTARLAKLKKGECHFMIAPRPADLEEIKKDSSLNLISQSGLNIAYWAFNVQKPPFDKKEVRQAFNMAIDKAAIIKDVYMGAGTAAKNLIGVTDQTFDLRSTSAATIVNMKTSLGDIVVELDGDPVSGEAALASAIRAHDPGDTVVLTIVRDGTRTTVEATLGVRPPD